MDTETLILAAAQIASGMTGREAPGRLVQGSTVQEIAKAAVAIAMAIGKEADAALSE